MKNSLSILALILQLLVTSNSHGFGIVGSDHSQLKRSIIADVGSAKEVPPPAGADWKNQVYSLNDKCFTMFGYYGYWGFGGKPAMLVVDENKTVKVAIFETSVNTINVKVKPVQIIKCPEHANIIPSCNGMEFEECNKMLEQYKEKLQKQMDSLK